MIKYLYAASGQNDNIEKAYVTKENYRKVKNFILHPDFEKANANRELILELKCYLKDYIDELIANNPIEKNSTEQLFNDIEDHPLEFAKELMDKLKKFTNG